MEANIQKALNIDIINKSQLHKFTSVTNVKNPAHEATYLDYVKLPSENGIPALGLQVFSKFVSVSTFRATSSVSRDQLEEGQERHGIDMSTLLNNVLANESSLMMFKLFKKYVSELATQSYLEDFTKWDKFKVKLFKLFGKKYQKIIKVDSTKKLHRVLVTAATKVMHKGRRGPATFAFCSPQTGALLSDNPAFTFASNDQQSSNLTGAPYAIGAIAGITVYVDPYMEWLDNTIYIGRTVTKDEPGIQAYFYEKGTELNSLTDDKTLSSKIILTTRFAIVPIGFYPHWQYTKIIYKPTKKMLK